MASSKSNLVLNNTDAAEIIKLAAIKMGTSKRNANSILIEILKNAYDKGFLDSIANEILDVGEDCVV